MIPSGAGVVLPVSHRFPIVEETLYLTSDTGTGASAGVKLLSMEPDTSQDSTLFLLPGVDILGLLPAPLGVSYDVWERDQGRAKDTLVVNDAVAPLYFTANAQALSVFELQLYDVAPSGEEIRLASDVQQFVTALSPTPVEFHLAIGGIVLLKDHFFRLELHAQTLNTAVLFQYGGDTPSALEGLRVQWLDTDGDGVADSDERALSRNPFNPNDDVATLNSGVDTDGDGLADRLEGTLGTNPNRVDTDGDGYGDGLEVFAGSDPLDANSKPYDVNNNGIPDSFEATYFNYTITPSTGPCTPGPGCLDPDGDPDNDGCTNLCEAIHGTDPTNPDTDGDGVSDGDELRDRTDPTSSISVYNGAGGPPEPVAAAGFFAVGTAVALIALLRRP